MALNWTTIAYRRKLPRPIITAHGRYDQREGFLVCVGDREGQAGLGDVAPLPGFSKETLNDARTRWDDVCEVTARLRVPADVSGLADVGAALCGERECPASLRFGIETALADLSARRAGVPLAQWLNSNAAATIEINALLHGGDLGDLRRMAREMSAAGYRSLKLKVGTHALNDDIERIRAVSDTVPDALIRIDVNGGWTAAQLRDACAHVSGLDLEFIEQPLPVGQAEEARAITQEMNIALALDEEADSVGRAQELITQRLCDVIVLKPMIVGGLSGCLHLVRQAAEAGLDVMFTSAWESDVGLAATMHLAAACGSGVRASGLSTAGMFAKELVHPPLRIADGRLEITQRPGLGMTLADNVRTKP
jgi:o-succinylbenzoate synthase